MAKCPGLGYSKLDLDNPGLVLKENSVEFFLSTI